MAKRSRPRRGRDQPRHRFRSRPTDPRRQAAGIVKRLQGTRIRSVGTARNYQERLAQIAARLDVALTALTSESAVAYLEDRAAQLGQKTLDMERQAIQAMMVSVTGQLPPGATLPVVKSTEPHNPKPRAPIRRLRSAPSPPGRTRATPSPPRSSTLPGFGPTNCSPWPVPTSSRRTTGARDHT